MSSRLERGRWYGWLFWGLAASFYLFEFFIRVTPNAILEDLGSSVNASETDIVTALSSYLWVYAPMQLVVGLLIDRFGSRFPLAVAAVACGAGSLLFAWATGLVDLGLGRGLQGFGSAFAFVGAIYVATIWCQPKRLALIVGLTTSVGMIGSIIGQAPVTELAADIGWRPLVRWFGFVGLALGAVLLVFIPSRPSWFNDHVGPEPEEGMPKDLGKILLNWRLLLIGIISAVLYMPQSVVAAMWGTTFLERCTGDSALEASVLVSILPFTWLIGCAASGWLSDRIGRRKGLLQLGCVVGGLGMGLLTFAADIGNAGLISALIIGGLFTSTQVLTFAVAMEVCPRSLRATAAALCNAVTMLAAAGIQITIAALLEAGADNSATGHTLANASIGDFQRAFAVIPISFVVAFVLLLFLPETGHHARSTAPDAAA